MAQSPRRLFLIAALLGLLGVGGYIGGWSLWAAYHYRLAQQAIDQRNLPRARAQLLLCLQVWPQSAAMHFLAARTARRADDYEDAAQHLHECQRLHGPPQDLELERAMLRAQQGDLAQVEHYLVQRVEQGHPDALLILEALTKGYAQTSRLPLALYCTEKWLHLQPDNVDALFWQGLFCERLFSPQKALEDFRRVVELDPKHEEARLRLAEGLRQFRRFQEALEQFQRLAQDNPENGGALLGLARCQSALGRFEEARALVDSLLRAQPEYAPALVERGKISLDTNQPADAESWLRKALTVAPSGRMANYLLAQCLEQRGQPGEARRYHTKVNQLDADWKRLEEVMRKLADTPLDPSLRYEAGAILLRVGEEEEGRRWLNALLADVPGHRPTHQALAEYYERTGDHVLAAHHRQRVSQDGGEGSENAPSRKHSRKAGGA